MVGHIDLYGEIGTRVTNDSVKAQINPNATEHIVHLHSEGGDVYEGILIYHTLKALPNVTVVVEGLSASIASFVMQAGKKIIALRPSDIMIHNPWAGPVTGDAKDFVNAAAQLERIKSTIISGYKPRMGKGDSEIAAMMDKETWMTADEAMASGIVDEVQDKLKAVAIVDLKKFNDMQNQEEVKGMFATLMAKFDNLLKPKAAEMTTDSGVSVMVEPSLEEGAKITSDGKPLADGSYVINGNTVTVAGGMITAVTEKEAELAAPEASDLSAENAALKSELETLKAQLGAKAEEAAKAAAQVQAANKQVLEFKNAFKGLQDEVKTLKNATIGDDSVPGAVPQTETTQQWIDPAWVAEVQGLIDYKSKRN